MRRAIPLLSILLAARGLAGCGDACTGEIVGSREACGDSCGATARRFDDDRACLGAQVAICARASDLLVLGCAVSVDTGDALQTSVPLRFDQTDAWIDCDDAMRAAVMAAPSWYPLREPVERW